jgi:hypothetical protein
MSLVLGWNYEYGLPSPNCHYSTQLKGDVIHSATSFLGSNQYNYHHSGSNLLDIPPPLILLTSSLTMLNRA